MTLANALLSRHWVLWHPSAADERLAISSELIELERQSGEALALPEARLCQIFDLLELGQRSALDRAIVALRSARAQTPRSAGDVEHARVRNHAGDHGRALRRSRRTRASETLEIGLPIHETNARVYYFAHMFWIRCEQGRAAEVDNAPDRENSNERWLLARGERLRLHCEAGNEAATSRYLEKLAQNDFDDCVATGPGSPP